MTPWQYADTFHSLPISDTGLGLDVTVKLEKYRSGWFPEDLTEADTVLGKIAVKFFKLKSAYSLPRTFSIAGDDRFDPTEEFYTASIRRAFCSRGSPDEITDALRLAVLTGRCSPGTASAYATNWFGQDCNAFVGNYLGVSPMVAIFAYAHGYKGAPTGGDRSIEACKDLLPLPPREDPSAIAQGDLILTYGSLDARKFRWRHVGLVEAFTPKGGQADEGGAKVSLADIKIGEWGTKGAANHKNTGVGKKVLTDAANWKPKSGDWGDVLGALKKEKVFQGKTLVAFPGTTPDGGAALRIFFDASSLDALDHRGWHCGETFGV